MTELESGQDTARQMISRLLAYRRMAPAVLSRTADLDPGTVADFLGGVRWPRPRTLAAIEDALDLTVGTIESIALGRAEAAAEVERIMMGKKPLRAGVEREAADALRAQLLPGLAEYSDGELLDELRNRILLMAVRLEAAGEADVLLMRHDTASGGDALDSRPPRI